MSKRKMGRRRYVRVMRAQDRERRRALKKWRREPQLGLEFNSVHRGRN